MFPPEQHCFLPYASPAQGSKPSVAPYLSTTGALPDVPQSLIIKSQAAVINILPGSVSKDGKLLLALSCFLARSDISCHILTLGASPRKRWTEQGGIRATGAGLVGLATDLESLLSDGFRLNQAVNDLQRLSAVSRCPDQSYLVDIAICTRLLHVLSPELHAFWRQQALVVIYRSIPWKYLEPVLVLRYPIAFTKAYFLQLVQSKSLAYASPATHSAGES